MAKLVFVLGSGGMMGSRYNVIYNGDYAGYFYPDPADFDVTQVGTICETIESGKEISKENQD